MKVLVTGGAGFIGSHLVEALLRKGDDVTIYDNLMRGEESLRNLWEIYESCERKPEVVVGDILDFDKLQDIVVGKDLIFHLAALPSHRLALLQPREYVQVDILGTANVLEAARLQKTPPKVFFASSNKVYGKNQVPFHEEMTPAPEGPYGQAKVASEDLCRMYHKFYGVPITIVRYHHVIGPRTQPDLVLSLFVERILQGEKPIVHGMFDGAGNFKSCAAAFTNIFDAVEGSLRAVNFPKDEVFNVGAEKMTTILELAEIIMRLLDHHVELEKRQMLVHESLEHAANGEKAKTLLGFSATTPVEESVKQYIDWRLKVGPRSAVVYR